jgi:hypothetical protein
MCHCSGAISHFGQDCPTRLDICLLSQDDCDDLLESLLALKNTAPMLVPEEWTGNGSEEEYFVCSSK